MAVKKGIDKENMRQILVDFPLQFEDSIRLAGKLKTDKRIDKILICGMGGSALPGEIINSYLDIKVPVLVNKTYNLPKHVNKNTLVFVISYSGNTEETIDMFKQARRIGCPMFALSHNGKLKKIASINKVPFVEIPDCSQPRFAYAYQTIPILVILENSGIIKGFRKEASKTLVNLNNGRFEAKGRVLAAKLKGKVPIIYSSQAMKGVAYKWKINFNENAKMHAFYNVFPELNHNEMVGYTHLNGKYHLIMLKDDADHPRIKKRMKIMKTLVKIPVAEIDMKGSCRLSKIFTTIYLGDWVSYYMAIHDKTDPTPVVMVESFKKRMG